MKGQINLLDEIIVDNFAGGGGASTGIELALGRPVNIAINHDPAAILMHKTNHPHTLHLQASVWDVDPEEVCAGRPVGLAWFSPDCKHFSKAKGSALVDRHIRGLAWIVLRWAGTVRPRVIILENVEEFQTWGPVRKGKPIKRKSGQTFQKWRNQLSGLGYDIEHRELIAADYGAPTTRKRFVLIARCDGKPIVWPERTHAPLGSSELEKGLLPWRSAAEIIDWTQPMYSIFATKQELKELYGVNAVRPLAENTLRRIIRGVDKFTIKSGEPFIIPVGYGERVGQSPRVHDINEPLSTVVSTCKQSLVEPVLSPVCFPNTGNSVGRPANMPVHTITSAGNQAIAVAHLVQCNHAGGDRTQEVKKPVPTVSSHHAFGVATAQLMSIGHTGGGDRIRDIQAPVPTTVSKQEACLLSANLIQYHTEQGNEKVRGNRLDKALPTIDASNRYGLTAAHLTEYYGNGNPLDLRDPLHTVTGHDREALTAVHIQKYFSGVVGSEVSEPLPTVTAIDHNAMAAVHISKFKGSNLGQSAFNPLQTITAHANSYAKINTVITKYVPGTALGYWNEVRSLLNRYCGYDMTDDEILLMNIENTWFYICDISMRMLSPRELYAAMGFPPDYIIDRDYTGRPYPKSQQVARCGNAVCPQMASAVVRANFPEYAMRLDTMKDLESHIAI